MNRPTIWDKIEPIPDAQSDDRTDDEKEPESQADSSPPNWRLRFRVANFASFFIWIFAATKAFVFDIDRWIIENTFPTALWLTDYRLLVLLFLVATFLFILRGHWLWIAYAAIYPLIAAFWLFPSFLYRRKSWTLLIALLNSTFSFFRNFRRNLFIRVLEAGATIIILTSDTRMLIGACAAFLFASLLFHCAVALKAGFQPSRFLTSQRNFVKGRLDFASMRHTIGIKPELRRADVVKFSQAQLQQFSTAVSAGLMVVKFADLYLAALDRYRRAGASLILALISFMWLFIQAIATLSLINLTLWKIDSSQFSATVSPDLSHFLYMSLSSLYGNSIAILYPVDGWAVGVGTFAGIYGPLLLISLVLQILLGYKQSLNESTFREVIAELRRVRTRLERDLEEEYEIPLDQALERLVRSGLGYAAWVVRLAAQAPTPPHASE